MAAVDILQELQVSTEEMASLCRRWRIKELSVFGSVARGEMTAGSDVDLLVEFEQDSRPRAWGFVDLKLELERLFRRPVDLVQAGTIENPYRLRAIMRDRSLIYAA
jgi:predicted nucleotidyltransferase